LPVILIVPVPNARTLVNPVFDTSSIPHVAVLLLISNVPLYITNLLVEPMVNASCNCQVAVDCGVLGPIVTGKSIVTPADVIVLVPLAAENWMPLADAVTDIPVPKVKFPYIVIPAPVHVPVNPVKFKFKTYV
jgi:hypothetical protein